MKFITKHGFTLAEVMVTISIVSIIMTVVLFSYREFSDKLALSAAGQEIAIAIRQAQTYGLSVKEVVSGGGNFDSAYGIYFDSTNNNTNKNYYIFADAPIALPNPIGNKEYDVLSGCGSGSTECVEKFTLRDGVFISSISDCPAARSMHITFFRPNPDAYIKFLNNGNQPACSTANSGADSGGIVLESPKGKKLTLTILNTGQVSIVTP